MGSIKDELLISALDCLNELEKENQMLESLLEMIEEDLPEIEEEAIEGLDEGGVVSKDEAVEGLAFYLENDRDFYLAYQDKLVNTIKECLPEQFIKMCTQNSNLVTHWSDPVYREIALDNINNINKYALKVAQKFLDDLIKNVKDTKEPEEKYSDGFAYAADEILKMFR